MVRSRILVLGLALTLLSGCSLAGRSLGMYVDDQAITASVKMGLARKEPRTLTRVNVDTFHGTVYLTGEVQSAILKSDAEIVAWKVKGVSQVVNDLTVRGERGNGVVSASPVMPPDGPPIERIPGIARMDAAPPGGGALAYDRAGNVVATVYVRPAREVAQRGFEALGPTERPIDHVSIHGVPAEAGSPEAQMYIVFWHVSADAAAALR